MKNKNDKIKRRFFGTVVSNKPDKTLIVKVDRNKWDKKYKRQYTTSKKFHVHDPRNYYKEGELVEIIACRPISKNKKWRVLYNKS
jgi:small subunit ribosomal protein S17